VPHPSFARAGCRRKSPRNSCQPPKSVQKPSTIHHLNQIKLSPP
jgi:hypothetical protein